VLEKSALLVDIPELAPGQSLRKRFTGPAGQSLLAWFGGITVNQQSGVFGVLQDISSIDRKLIVFHWFTAILSGAVLLSMLTVQRIIVRRSVAKLDGIRRDMLKLEHGQAVALAEDVPAEVRPLVVEFNQLLRRFEQRLRQSRNAVGNLAHSLKGPLNLLIRYSESDVINEQQRQDIAHNANHIGRLIESELKRARMAGRGAVGVRFDIDAELPAMIGLLEQVYSDKKVRVQYEVGDDVELVHDRQDMLELIGNLLDNAVKWCDSLVVLKIHSADGVVIDVDDDGPGCSPELLSQLTGRGVRLDESVSGHGLGLSIVKDIVDTYRGSLVLEHSDLLGGLHVSVYLPVTQR
jgi:signal transduction histidine kinase